jgi:hypothetical protein
MNDDCLATVNNTNKQLSLEHFRSSTHNQPIQLDNECEHLCLNESGRYVFVVVKPRLLLMYRVDDSRRLARLFVYDFVTSIIADEHFIVLAMNDRRLLTLMIADPDDPQLASKIQALPSR